MADDNNIDPNLINKLKEALNGAKLEMKELYAMSTAYGASLKIPVEVVNKIVAGREKELRLVDTLHNTLQRVGEESERGLRLKNLTNQISETANDIAAQQNKLMADIVLKQTMIKTGLTGIYAEQAKNYKVLLDQGEITQELYNNTIKRLQAEQKLNNHLQDQLDLEEATAAKLAEIKEETEAWKHSLTKVFETAKAIGRDPKVFGAFALGQMVEKGEKVLHQFHELDKTGMSVGQRVQYMSKSFSIMSALGLSDTKGVLDGMLDSYGTLNAMTDSQVDHVGHLAKEMGVTGQEAFAMVDTFSKMPGETMETAAHTADFVNNLAKANGIAPGKITKDIAKNTEATALFSAKGAKGFAQAAVEIHKMGVDIGTASKMAQGLLNFEDSINKQMEASVLLGREVNLDKARELALSGDLEGATREIMANIGGAAEFEKMNVLQKQALAQATGMTVEELAKAVDAQEEFNKYHGEDASMWQKGLGYAMEYGSAVGGFLKENGMLLLTAAQAMSNGTLAKMKDWAVEKARFAWQKTAALASAGWAKLTGGGGKTPESKMPEVKTDALDKSQKMKGGGGFKSAMKGLADGLKQMAGAKVLQGIGNTALAGPAMILAIGSIPFMIGVSMLGVPAGIGLQGLSEGLKGKGMGAALVAVGNANLALFGLAAIIGVAGIPFMIGVSMFGFLAGLGLKGLAAGLKAMANPMVAFGVGVLSLLVISVGAGMLMFGIGVGVAAAGMSLLVGSLKDVPFENLIALPLAFMGIGAGLYLMAAAGMAAMPILLALTAFAVAAPALTALGGALGGLFGGEGGGEKEDKMNELLTEIRGLRSDMNKGGVINMDGKKVGDVIRLGMNSSGVR